MRTSPRFVQVAASRIAAARHQAEGQPVHSPRTAALLGIALGVTFGVCFITGLLSRAAQNPTDYFGWPARPAGLYRVTQGIHVTTGLATVPLLLAKLWSVYPKFFSWPPFASVTQLVERIMLIPLVSGATFMLFSGAANIAKWYPWRFPFPVVHYWVAWITMGALVAHIGAKLATTRLLVRRAQPVSAPSQASAGMSRRDYLALSGLGAAFIAVTTVGQTVYPLRKLTLFGPRRPDIGPQGLPVNGVATRAIRTAAGDPAYRFAVVGDVDLPLVFSLNELRALPRRSARLPIACVEGWSATADWAGVPMRDFLRRAGVSDDATVVVTVHSLQRDGAYNYSTLNNAQARDPDTLIALTLNGEELHPDHGYPCRLIGPNRPGVHQTKWLRDMRVRVI